jgi:mRNA interferase MazF
MLRGELYLTDWNPARGSEQAGRRPAVVIQADAGNRNPRYPNTIIAAVTSRSRDILTHVSLEPTRNNGLNAKSYVKCEQVITISKDRLLKRIGQLSSDDMDRVEAALKLALEIK